MSHLPLWLVLRVRVVSAARRVCRVFAARPGNKVSPDVTARTALLVCLVRTVSMGKRSRGRLVPLVLRVPTQLFPALLVLPALRVPLALRASRVLRARQDRLVLLALRARTAQTASQVSTVDRWRQCSA